MTRYMNDELKPCPFCGCAAQILKLDGNLTGIVGHCCRVIGIEMRTTADAWNTRVVEEQWQED